MWRDEFETLKSGSKWSGIICFPVKDIESGVTQEPWQIFAAVAPVGTGVCAVFGLADVYLWDLED